jgi:uncharacterized protein
MNNADEKPITSAAYYEFLKEHHLMAAKCQTCENMFLPPRAICPNCFGNQMNWVELSGKGELAAFTAISIGPSFLNHAGYGRDNPYLTGIVTLEEGVQISARLIGWDARFPEQILIKTPGSIEFLDEGPDEAHKTVLAFKPTG